MDKNEKSNLLELKGYKEHLEENIKEAHGKLYDSEKYLSTIVESSLDGIAVIDEEGRFEFGNVSFFNIVGWPKEELMGHFFLKAFPENMRDFVMKCREELKKGIGIPYETTVKTKIGEVKYIYVSHSQVEIRGKRRYVCVIKDISEKKKLELALKESEKEYIGLFENAIDVMYVNDTEGYILNVNKAGLKMLGASAEDVIGTHVSRWFTPESFRLTQETIRKRILGEPADDPMVRQIITKSGECRWVEIRSRIIKDGDRVAGFHGMMRDITEKIGLEQKVKEYQKQLESSYLEVKEAEEKYRDLFENANDSIYVYDSEGYFKEVNNTALKLLGCAREEIIGTHISRWITPESLKITQENLKKRIIAGKPVDEPFVLEVICKNGEHRWMEIKRRLIKDGDRLIAIHGIGRDITENRRLKQELKESNAQLKLLRYLMEGTRGGNTRALILKNLSERPHNANQLAEALNLDYKTVRHHLNVLLKNGIITKKSDGYTAIYFISKIMEAHLQ